MREARALLFLARGADVVPHVDRGHRHAVILVQDHAQPVRQRELRVGELDLRRRRGGSLSGRRRCDREDEQKSRALHLVILLLYPYRFMTDKPLVGVIMGSKSDWETMSQADAVLTEFGIPHEARVVSAHRTPAWMAEYASSAASRGLEVIIAGAGGAAHLPGMVAAQTVLPVIGVPVQSAALNGLDPLLSIVQMPKRVPVATVAIGSAGAVNAGLLAIAILATSRPDLRAKLQQYRERLAADVRSASVP